MITIVIIVWISFNFNQGFKLSFIKLNNYNNLYSSTILIENNININKLNRNEWMNEFTSHYDIMIDLLYPPGDSIKSRLHLINENPIYNFLHTYYRYTTQDLLVYSPGHNVILEDVNKNDINKYVNSKYTDWLSTNSISYHPSKLSSKQYSIISKIFDILLQTSMRPPHFGCFGYHEWAMLYSGRNKLVNNDIQLPKHQEKLNLRVSQDVIDYLVESESLKCTHFDAWRFFHPNSQPLNYVPVLSRSNQSLYEQPGCIHATMDLFKYAYTIYPLISSSLLIESLKIAKHARVIDMRASPYDLSSFIECRDPITVENIEGRREYVREQERLYAISFPIRLQLLQKYKNIIEIYNLHHNVV